MRLRFYDVDILSGRDAAAEWTRQRGLVSRAVGALRGVHTIADVQFTIPLIVIQIRLGKAACASITIWV